MTRIIFLVLCKYSPFEESSPVYRRMEESRRVFSSLFIFMGYNDGVNLKEKNYFPLTLQLTLSKAEVIYDGVNVLHLASPAEPAT